MDELHMCLACGRIMIGKGDFCPSCIKYGDKEAYLNG